MDRTTIPPDGNGGGSRDTLWRVATVVGYGVGGLLTTAVVALVAVNLGGPFRGLVYDLVYLQVGPSEAAETAILARFLLSIVVGLGVSMLLGDYLDDRLDNATAVGTAVVAMLTVVGAVLVVGLAGVDTFAATLVALVVVVVGVPFALRYGYGVRSGAVPAFVGGVPVVLVLLLLTAFGIGWGWGYVLTAEEVPASSVEGPAADFDEVPEVRDDLFDGGNCETVEGDRRECWLYLRGYEHERTAARFMADHGVRCPDQSTLGRSGAFVAEHDGTYYRVTCTAHGD